MALISKIENFTPRKASKLLRRADELCPVLYHADAFPVAVYPGSIPGDSVSAERLEESALRKGDSVCLDFGTHLVGRVTLELDSKGSHQDAPAWFALSFAETLGELEENTDDYEGWVSSSWIQREVIHVDVLPYSLRLPRRYAFRYMRITVLDTSPKYHLLIKRVLCRTETSADPDACRPRRLDDPLLDRIYSVSLKTLKNCMQTVFEDGPKRDRRLWMGDLRIEALANYASYRNYSLVKRCLYLFGGSRFPDGRVSACLFTDPEPEADDTFLFDYALMYTVALEEYMRETDDAEALEDLYETAMEQIEYGLSQCTENDLISPQAAKDTFIDWNEEMDKTACAQGVLIYSLDYAIYLAERRKDTGRAAYLKGRQAALREAARKAFWSEEQKCFLSNGEASPASQVWMVLSGVSTPDQSVSAMRQAAILAHDVPMQTPYLHHYYVEAMLKAGLYDEAVSHLKSYWGSMLEAGADTFWDAWDPEHPDFSPYGGTAINSYCHAWSCGPAYILSNLENP
jgi:hypothetical protein